MVSQNENLETQRNPERVENPGTQQASNCRSRPMVNHIRKPYI